MSVRGIERQVKSTWHVLTLTSAESKLAGREAKLLLGYTSGGLAMNGTANDEAPNPVYTLLLYTYLLPMFSPGLVSLKGFSKHEFHDAPCSLSSEWAQTWMFCDCLFSPHAAFCA